jgi:hypothetical protein
MKKNNLLPILLVAGAGVAAYIYFKNKKASKEIADGVDIEPMESKTTSEDQSTTTSEETEPQQTNAGRLIKTASSIYKGARQVFKGRKKRKSRVIVEPTESSSTPFAETTTTRKNRRLAKRTERRTARATKRTTRKETRTARRSARKSKKVLTGFEF